MADEVSFGFLVTGDQELALYRPDTEAALWSGAVPATGEEFQDLAMPVRFRLQPKQIDARRRVVYRSSLLVLVLSRFNRQSSSIENMHTLMWAMRSQKTRALFLAWWAGRRFRTTVTQRIDPDLELTIKLALADSLIEVTSTRRLKLIEKGQALAELIEDDEQLLRKEKKLLTALRPLSDAQMIRHLGGEL